jgi:MFS family permease
VLGRLVDRLGEARLTRLGILCLSAGLALTGASRSNAALFAGFTLMPIGTAFIFPCLTGLLSRAVSSRERGLYMGVQHLFGGMSRVAFPIAAGVLMDHFDVGVPFWIAGALVLAGLPLTRGMGAQAPTAAPPAPMSVRELATADISGEITGEYTSTRTS